MLHAQLAVNLSMIFTEVPLLQRFSLAKQAGFQHVEIQFPYELSIEQIKQQLDQHHLKLCLINVPAGDLMQGGLGLACHPHKREIFKTAVQTALDYAQALSVPRINILSGRYKTTDDFSAPEQYDPKHCWETWIENLNDTVKHSPVQFVFEMINPTDMPYFLVQNLEQCRKTLDHIPNIQLQFDCYHVAKIGQPILETLTQFLPHIGHIQFADYPHRHEPDTGALDFQAIFQAIQQTGYPHYLAAEYRPQRHSQHSFAWLERYFHCPSN